MKRLRLIGSLDLKVVGIALAVLLVWPGVARSQSWQPLQNQPPFGASNALLLTDGTVMVQQSGGADWWRLTPDANGNYVNGTWSQLASLPSGYSPLYYASAVLPDGRVIVEGGEYNLYAPAWSAQGAIYDPTTNTWTSVAPPSGWYSIGDGPSVVLADGHFMLGNCCTAESALFDPTTLTWTVTGTGKADNNNEEGWTLLPDGSVLAIDANNTSDLTYAERYMPISGAWISAGSTLVKLDDTDADGSQSHELGPAVLRPDGTVFATGATGHTAIYNAKKNTWAPGPDFPDLAGEGQLDIADGPACLLPSGRVLVAASPRVFQGDIHFFEFDGTSLTEVSATPNAPYEPSYVGRMLLLPTGQILFTDGSGDAEIYTSGGSPKAAWAPTIKSAPRAVSPGGSYTLSGTRLNGLSQGAAYGDDAQAATNYPLVRITNRATGHVFYSRTHDHSSMGVASSGEVSTLFDVPADQELGASDLVVVANGIPSRPIKVTVTGGQ